MTRRLAAGLLGLAALVGLVSGLIGATHRVTEDADGRLVTCGRTLLGGGSDPLCRTFDGWRWISLAGLVFAVCLAAVIVVSLVRRRRR